MRSLLALGVLVSILALTLAGAPHAANDGPPAVRPPEATGAWQARQWRRLAWQDELGEVPADGLRNALAHRQLNLRAAADRALEPAAFGPGDWNELGPTNVSGRTRSLLIDPADPDVLIAGSVSGGVFRSTDAGATWAPVDDFLPNLAACCLERDPSNADVIYLGTGEGFFNGDAIEGVGIFKSADRGLTWTQMPSTAGWDTVNRISVSPTDPMTILASVRYGGIYRTTNGGDSWTQVRPAQGSFDVDFHPTDGSKAIAHIIDYDFGVQDWFHSAVYSTNGGQTWNDAAGLNTIFGFSSRIEVGYAPSNPTITYGSCGAGGGTVWRSTDGGQSYTQTTTAGTSGASWYYNPLWIDPTNPNYILVGGTSIYRSTNAGGTLTFVAYGYIQEDVPHADVHGFFHEPGFDGVTNRRVYVVTDGGVYRTDNIYTANDSQLTWDRLDTQKVSTQFYGAAGDKASGIVVGGTQDNGTLRVFENFSTAALTFGGDGGWCAIDPTNPNYLYGEYVNLSIFRSTNGGNSGAYIYNNLGDAFGASNFIAPFILDPNDPNVLLAGGARLWRTTNAKALSAGAVAWSDIKPSVGSNISAIAAAEGDSDIIWVGHNNGRVYKTTNGTDASPTWETVAGGGLLSPIPDRYITRIVIDPDDHDTVYIALGGFASNNLWRTTNGGTDWTDVSGAGATGIPAAPIRGLARHPLDADWLYAGTEVGIFATTDGGATWTTTNVGPASVSIDELNFMHGSTTLLAATHGRGLWTVETAIDPVPPCPGDANGDGVTDIFDFNIVTANFGLGPGATRELGDLTGDGLVNVFDFNQLTGDFGCGN